MKILNDSINEFMFKDIVSFCREGQIEGYQLDYKKELPSKGLSKHFASFSNSRGGVIIIGIEEDSTGKPVKYEGLVYNSKIIDKIHQYASNVDPRPLYDAHVTDEENGRVFILIRIYEGDRTPYYVQNDPNIYVRTGNITDPIDLASPEAVELLFGKKEKAELARINYIKKADEVFEAALDKANKEKSKNIAEEKANHLREVERAKLQGVIPSRYQSEYSQGELGSEVSMLTLLLQPFYPKKAFLSPSELKKNMDRIRVRRNDSEFPNFNLKPVQDGLLSFVWGRNGSIDCHQLYSNGLLYYSEDVLRQDEKYGRRIYIETIARNLYMFLKSASNFYNLLNYRGGLKGFMRLEDINGAKLKRIVPNDYRSGLFWDEETEVPIMNYYQWDIELETSLISEGFALQSYLINFIKEIYWSLGYEDVADDLLKSFFKDNGWLLEGPKS